MMPRLITNTLAAALAVVAITGSAQAKNKFDFKSGLSQFGEPAMLQMDFSNGKYSLRSKTHGVPIRYHAEVSGSANLHYVDVEIKHILYGRSGYFRLRSWGGPQDMQRKAFGNVNLPLTKNKLAVMEKLGAELCATHNGSKAKLINTTIPIQMTVEYRKKGNNIRVHRDADMPAIIVCNSKSAADTSSFKVKMTSLKLYTIPAKPRCGKQVKLITELWTNLPGKIKLRLTRGDGGTQNVSLTTAKVSGGFSKRWAKTYTFNKSVNRKYKISANGSPFSTPWVPLKISCGANTSKQPGALKN
ncbi:MAG: hypothetical protein GY742_19415 [Hyphomicrobiales bacterium]|nr:hypothetical protein [Hyphomicrobiales bacterium]